MKKLLVAAVLSATLVFSGLSFAQVLSSEDPFPESGTQSQSLVFDTSKAVTLTGTISQEITRPTSNLSYLFFRVIVNGTTWTVKIHDQKLSGFAQFCGACLADEYTPEMSRVKSGMTVTFNGYETKKHDNRILLVPVSGPRTMAGMTIPNGNN